MASSEIVAASGGKPYLYGSVLPEARGISGIDEADWDMVERLLRVWRDKQPGNILRTLYYDAHQRLKDFGISMPDKIKSNLVMPPVGWPAKAVRTLADLSSFEGFRVDGAADGALQSDVDGLFDMNALDTVVSQTIVSAYKHSCAFLTVTAGSDGTPRVTPRSAEWSSAVWDTPRNRIRAAMSITDADEDGDVTAFSVWLPDRLYECSKTVGRWKADVKVTNWGRPTVAAR